MANTVNARDSVGDDSSFTRVNQDYEEHLEANGGTETPVDLAYDDAKGRESAAQAAATAAVATSGTHPAMIPAGDPRHRGFGSAQEKALARQELKALIVDYKGFGILTLIRLLLFRNFRCMLLGIMGVMLMIGQWAGPVGYSAAKFTNDEGLTWCDGNAGPWARMIIASVAMIYFARLSTAALRHRQRLPKEFEAYNMPKWWPFYRHMDLVVTSLFYDTCIFTVNLLVVYSDAIPESMVVDVLALEFFTLLDDEFKTAILQYDDSWLDDMLLPPGSSSGGVVADRGPRRRGYSEKLSSWQPSPPGGRLGEALFDVNEVDEDADRPPAPSSASHGPADLCCDGIVCLILIPLMVIRLACRIGGPLFSLFMVWYGPYCLAARGNV